MNVLVIGNRCEDKEKIKSIMDNYGAMADYTVMCPDKHKSYVIDTEGIDYIYLPAEEISSGEIGVFAEHFKNRSKKGGRNIVSLKSENTIRYIDKSRIIFIEVSGRTSSIYTTNNKYVVCGENLSKLIERIDDPFIIRCHRSYALNARHIESLHKIRRGIWQADFKNGMKEECLISVTYCDEVISRMEKASHKYRSL